MTKIILVGNGITAEVLLNFLQHDSRYQVVGLSAQSEYLDGTFETQLPIVPLDQLTEQFNPDDHQVLMAIGYHALNQTRARLFETVKAMGYQVLTYIHPEVKVYSKAIGEGSIILPNVVIEPCATIGENCVVWSNCVIGHHSTIKEHCWIASGTVTAGHAEVGSYSFIGLNATISNQVKIAKHNIIGASTAIFKNTGENQVYLSSQGEKIRFNSQDYAKHFLK